MTFMKNYKPTSRKQSFSRQAGFSLVELMIASAISLVIMAAMATIFVSNLRSRNELEKASRQIENGRFAIQSLREDITLAGFYGDLYPPTNTTWSTPDPCTTVLQNMGFTPPQIPVAIYGYTEAEALPVTCNIANRKANTDVLVIRRVSTNSVSAPPPSTPGDYYLQASNCSDETTAYVMDRVPSQFNLHGVSPAGSPPSCLNGSRSAVRKYVVRLYYIATCNDCSGSGDGVPTLKMVELKSSTSACSTDPSASCGQMETVAIAEGIENIQFEYGIDSAGNNGVPDIYKAAPLAADWPNAVGVKVFLLARNTESTPGYTDNKTYSLNSAGTALTDALDPSYKRHVYVATVSANNIAGRRQ